MNESDQEYIWVNRWTDFQTYSKKRGQPWTPPWTKLYGRLLDDPAWLDLTAETRSLLVGIWMLFGRSRGTVTKDTRRLSRQLHQRVTKPQLERLNHAGFITFCSGTVREQMWNAFLNGSIPDLELEQEQDLEQEKEPSHPTPPIARSPLATASGIARTTGRVGGENENGTDPQPLAATVAESLTQAIASADDDDIPFT